MDQKQKKHIIEEGECLISIAHKAGIPLDRITSHADNAELMVKRESPSIMLPGDEVTVPEKELKQEPVETEQRHRFRRVLEKAEIRIRIHEFGEPRANEPFHVMVGDQRYDGESETTDDDGLAICQVPPDAEEVTLVLGENEDEYEVQLGRIDPPDTVSGMHGRLENLGFYDAGVYTPWDEESTAGMSDFVAERDPAGAVDQDCTDPEDKDLQQKLKDEYGS